MIQEALEDTKSMKGSRLLNLDGNKRTEAPLNRPTTPSIINKLYGGNASLSAIFIYL